MLTLSRTETPSFYITEQTAAPSYLPRTDKDVQDRLAISVKAVLNAGNAFGLADLIVLMLQSPSFLPWLIKDVNLDVFKCQSLADVAKLAQQPTKLKDCRGSAAYAIFADLPTQRQVDGAR